MSTGKNASKNELSRTHNFSFSSIPRNRATQLAAKDESWLVDESRTRDEDETNSSPIDHLNARDAEWRPETGNVTRYTQAINVFRNLDAPSAGAATRFFTANFSSNANRDRSKQRGPR